MTQPAHPQPVVDISVSLSTRERPAMLSRCLDALLAGESLPKEILVVDQSREDATFQVVERVKAALPTGSAVSIQYFHQNGSGLGSSQNLAFEHANCPVVAVTDDDCLPMENWLSVLAAAFAGSEPVDVLTGRVLPYGPDQPGGYPVASRLSMTRKEFTPEAMPWEIGSGNNFAARRIWLQRVGGNDTRLGPGSPGQGAVDIDLFYRLLKAGARIRYEPDLLVYHERTDLAGRIGRRSPYGYGMGACCSLHLRKGDWNAARIFARWTLMRLQLLAQALRRRDRRVAREELLVLRGTLRGCTYAWRLPRAPSDGSPGRPSQKENLDTSRT